MSLPETDEQCFDIIVCDDDDLNLGCYTQLRENIRKADKYGLVDELDSKVVSFLT